MGLQWNHKIFNVQEVDFASLALEIFRFQALGNSTYRAYLDALGIDAEKVTTLDAIPFLPINFFKSRPVQVEAFPAQIIFESSGTTGRGTSRHYVSDVSLYEESFTRGFESIYGPVKDWCVLGLLPSYLERSGSSLVYMVRKLIEDSKHEASGFYLRDMDSLASVISKKESDGQKTLLIGVSYALLDLAERYPMELKETVLMETGGMKGRREELVREELHQRLRYAFGIEKVHSEYGMTELLSQAYSGGDGIFQPPPWMRVVLRDEEDPFTIRQVGAAGRPASGIINVIDLANVYSCSFIATDDIGRLYDDGSFEVLGRVDGSDLRGCSLLVMDQDQ